VVAGAKGKHVTRGWLLLNGVLTQTCKGAKVFSMTKREIHLKDVSWVGPPIDDLEILDLCPPGLRDLLGKVNGFIQFKGAFHVRGASAAPAWHSLRNALQGPLSFCSLYPEIKPGDVPFAEDALGDQYFLRGDLVMVLQSESGDVKPTGVNFHGFMLKLQDERASSIDLGDDSVLGTGKYRIQPGELLGVWPPYVMKHDGAFSMKPQPTLHHRLFLADLAEDIRTIPDGGNFNAAKFLGLHPWKE
jgi:hypothetical protein